MHDRVSVPSADFIRNIGYWQSEALRHPISITHHGRERLVLAAPDQFGVPAAENERNLAAELAQALNLSSLVLDQVEEGYLRLDERFFDHVCQSRGRRNAKSRARRAHRRNARKHPP